MAKQVAEYNCQKLDEIAILLQQLVAVELWRSGLTQAEIGKRLGIAKAVANKLLKDVKKQIALEPKK